jgi:hypothetical protein
VTANMSTKLRKAFTILAALATIVLNVYTSYRASDFIYLHWVFEGNDLRDLTPGDGIGMLALWIFMLILGWVALFFIWRWLYSRIST